ncbi:MAG: 50S ribosomal protein L29 [Desulfatibacillaceae bacterium]|nr:50S ribosomal protein L29 [Desulfatibacillaceae bacterium]
MKVEKIREMTVDEISAKIADAYQEVFNLRFQHATGQLENPMRLKLAKREVARLKTILNQKQSV